MSYFKDRVEAGKLLAERIKNTSKHFDVVLAIPRGGVIVGDVVATHLNLPLNILLVKKIGAPFNKEFAIGAVDLDGNVYLSELASYYADENYILEESARLKKELIRRLKNYTGSETFFDVSNKSVLVVDDGVATGLTSIAGARFLKKRNAKSVVLATPVLPKDTLHRLSGEFDNIIYLLAPQVFNAVGEFYANFEQVSDEEVKRILAKYLSK